MSKDRKSPPDPASAEVTRASPAPDSIALPRPPDLLGQTGGSNPRQDEHDRHQSLYKGASGQMAVLSEFLYRLMNVAVPEVDVGDDIFVVKEQDEAVTRVQVK